MNTYKEKLEKEKVLLETELASSGDKSKTTGDWQGASKDTEPAIDPNEVADQIEELVNNTPVVEELEIRLRSVNAALEKLENGTHGVCEKCKGAIPEDRLAANPAASTCITCAE